jgi:hypothetical protein
MALSRFLRQLGLGATLAAAAALGSNLALAVETTWINPGTGDWATNSNWDGVIVDETPLWQFSEAAAINNFGTAVVSTDRSQLVAGDFVNQGVAGVRIAGTAAGTLSIVAGGNLTSSTNGEDGAVNVGFGIGGTGTLIMNGASGNPAVLTAPSLVVGGVPGSLVNLSGYSNMNITNNITNAVTQGSGAINFDRQLRITGPNVNVTATGPITVSNYTAIITGAAHSTIKTPGSLTINTGGGGTNLNVQFSGHAPALGNVWTLFDTGSVGSTRWDNLAATGQVPFTGATLPVGTSLRLRTTGGGMNGQQLQVAVEANLVLTVNRSTGEMSLRNPFGAPVTELTGYEITSARGSLVSSYKGISGAPAGNAGWEKADTNNANGLGEFKPVGAFNVSTAGTTVTLGTGFNRLTYPTAAGLGGLGQTGEDLVFRYTSYGGQTVVGQVEYTGTAFLNNVSIIATPSGQAVLKNDSTLPLAIDGYLLTSSTGALSGAGWTSLADRTDARFDGWQETPASPGVIAESNPDPTPVLTIAAGESFPLGDIGDFSTPAAQAGLSFAFILNNEAAQRAGSVLIVPSLGIPGDFDGNGRVNGDDLMVWQRNTSVGNLADWRANFGMPGTSVNAAGVPEPSSIALAGLAVAVVALRRRSEPTA